MQEQGERGHQRHDPRIRGSESGRAFAVGCDGRLGKPLYTCFGKNAIVAYSFYLQQTSVRVACNSLEIRQISDAFFDAEILGVVYCEFGSGGAVLFEVLLE